MLYLIDSHQFPQLGGIYFRKVGVFIFILLEKKVMCKNSIKHLYRYKNFICRKLHATDVT